MVRHRQGPLWTHWENVLNFYKYHTMVRGLTTARILSGVCVCVCLTKKGYQHNEGEIGN